MKLELMMSSSNQMHKYYLFDIFKMDHFLLTKPKNNILEHVDHDEKDYVHVVSHMDSQQHLTEHQKEVKQEKKQNLPVTYTALDNTQEMGKDDEGMSKMSRPITQHPPQQQQKQQPVQQISFPASKQPNNQQNVINGAIVKSKVDQLIFENLYVIEQKMESLSRSQKWQLLHEMNSIAGKLAKQLDEEEIRR